MKRNNTHPASPFSIVFFVTLSLICFLFSAGCEPQNSASDSDSAINTGGDTINSTPDSNNPPDTTVQQPGNYTINGSGQTKCFSNTAEISCPAPGSPFYGQDAQFGKPMSFKDNGDGTVTDLNTGLTWVKAHGEKMSWQDAVDGAKNLKLGGHSDWRLPTIKELYSLINFSGGSTMNESSSVPYLDTNYFSFIYGDSTKGERLIDAQYWSATKYVHTTMSGDPTAFGVNFADGRIKGYPIETPDGKKFTAFVKYVRGNTNYGKNDFVDNNDNTISDKATTLMWQKSDSVNTMNWEDALAYCENLELAGHTDWRLPNAKELQSIVDYSRAPKVTNSAAIDPLFQISETESYFWTSTTHTEGPDDKKARNAVYVCFGRALGYMSLPPSNQTQLIDVHGAGAQRSDPKTGDPNDYPTGFGPQGDDIRIFNYVRCVR